MNRAVFTGYLLGLGMAATWGGCAMSESSFHPFEVAAVSGETSRALGMQSALEAWNSGREQEAVEVFLYSAEQCENIDDLVAFAPMSEADFARLAAADRKVLLTGWLETVSEVRALSRAVIEAGHDVARAGEGDAAVRYFAAVERVGGAHLQSDRVELVQALGRALVKGADAARDDLCSD